MRPRKQEKREKILNIRLTELEYALLQEQAQKENMPISKYARHLLCTKKPETHYEITTEKQDLKDLLKEHHKIGINLNQIARHLNTGGTETEEIRQEIRKAITALWQS